MEEIVNGFENYKSMEDIVNEYDNYDNYWETNRFLQNEELNSWGGGGLEETFSGHDDSSSPDGPQSATASKNIVSERNRRNKLKEKLLALRAAVPNISKLDRASVLKDAIDYIQHLHEQERTIQGEITELKSRKNDYDRETILLTSTEISKNKETEQSPDSSESRVYPVENLELELFYTGEKTVLVQLKCRKRNHTMVKICEVIESLKLDVLHAHIATFSDTLSQNLHIQADEKEIDFLKTRIYTAISALNDPPSPMST